MNKIIAFAVFLLCSVVAHAAVLPPELKCVSVDANGQATITWIPPADPLNEFVEYQVFVSDTKNGAYTMNVVGNITTTTFTDVINDANLGDYFYFVQTVYNEGAGDVNSMSSDTAGSILPIFGPVTDSTAVVEWDPVFVPNIGSNSGNYEVYRKIGSQGNYVLIGNPIYGDEHIFDEFKVCFDTIYYRIENTDASGCTSVSAILIDEFKDATAPAIPKFDSITVFDNNGVQQVQLGWSPSTSLDTRGYTVFYWTKATQSYVPRDTILGINNTIFQESLPVIDPSIDWAMYTINAFDSCVTVDDPNGNTSAGADEQRTIHLTITPNNCEGTITLNWTPYINWPDIDGYEILVSVNNGPYLVAKDLPVTDTVFVHQKTDDLAKFCYKVRGYSTNHERTSTSNFKCAIANSAIIPSRQYFKRITVENNEDVLVESLTDTTLPVSQYVLFRSLEKVENFFEVDRIPFENSSIISFNDYNASVDQTSYYYRIGVEDTCGSLLFITQPGASIFLEGIMDEDSLNVMLSWNEYQGWDTVSSGVDEYAINLIIDGNKMEVGSVANGVTNFTYLIDDKITLGANFCFEIEAREADGNRFGMRDTVLSNQVCFTDNLKVFVPNAFRPNGQNPVFYPVISYGEISTYSMKIYDRWGGVVFETNEISEGWDGTLSGSNAPLGAYVYYIEVANFTGAIYKKRGTFVLLR